MKLTEIASRIDVHLNRLEADPVVNARPAENKIKPFFNACARVSGRFISVCYVSFQGSSNLSKDDALKYLAALDAGGTDKHYAVIGRV